jgi:hypothetical protein
MFDEQNNIIYLQKGVKEYVFNQKLPYKGAYKVCFSTTDGTTKKISFDFEL